MTNPFLKDDRLYKMKSYGCAYCVVCPESDTQLDFMGFMNESMALKEAEAISKIGLWAYVIALSDLTVAAYLSPSKF